MKAQKLICGALIGSLSLAPLTGCENLPGDEKTQGAVIGGAGGALAGAAIAKDNRLLGGLIGGALGAAGGYVVGGHFTHKKFPVAGARNGADIIGKCTRADDRRITNTPVLLVCHTARRCAGREVPI